MFGIIVFILFGLAFGHDEESTSLPIDGVFSSQTTKCGHITIQERRNMRISFTSKHYFNLVWCENDGTGIRVNLTTKIKDSKNTYNLILKGEDEFEGRWNCTFQRHYYWDTEIGIDCNGKYCLSNYCSLGVKIERNITLTVTDSKNNTVKARNNERLSFYYTENANVSIVCKKENEFTNGTVELYYRNDNTTRINGENRTLHKNDSDSEIVCVLASSNPEVPASLAKVHLKYNKGNPSQEFIDNEKNGELQDLYSKDSQIQFSITNTAGGVVSSFKNGENLLFTCLVYAGSTAQILIRDGLQEFPLCTKRDGNNCTKRHEMNITNSEADVTCQVIKKRQLLGSKLKTLTRINDTDVPSGNFTNGLQEFFYDNIIWLGLAGGLIIIVILIYLVTRSLRTGRQEQAKMQRTANNYENLTNNCQEPTPPFPRGPKLEQTYLAPIDLHESPYAETKPQGTDTYALPYIPTNVEDLYTRPVPKNMRVVNETSKYVNAGIKDDLNYAMLKHRNDNKKPKTKGKNEKRSLVEDNYASIAHGSQNYANLDKTRAKDENYTNVFNPNDSYVNARREEYAEPSYCEVNRKY